MGKKRYPRFKVIGDNGIEVWWKTRQSCEDYISRKLKEHKKKREVILPFYSIIEYGASNGEKKKDRPKRTSKTSRHIANTKSGACKNVQVKEQSIATNPIEQRKKNSWLEIAECLERSNPET